MAKKKPSISIDDIFKEEKKEMADDLFDVTTSRGLVNIPINKISPNPNQPRKTFYEQSITELSESIKEHGVLSPIIVRPKGKKYQIIAGERRYKAASQAGLKEISAIIKRATDEETSIISLIENIQREDLNDVDRAAALKELKVNLGSPWEDIAKKLGLSKRRVLDLVGLLSLPEYIQEDIRHRKLSEKHGRALRQLVDQDEKIKEAAAFIKEKKLTGDQSIQLIRTINGEPGFTIEQAYKQIEIPIKTKEDAKKDPLKAIISEGDRLIKVLDNIKEKDFKKEEKEVIQRKLTEIQEKIEILKYRIGKNK